MKSCRGMTDLDVALACRSTQCEILQSWSVIFIIPRLAPNTQKSGRGLSNLEPQTGAPVWPPKRHAGRSVGHSSLASGPAPMQMSQQLIFPTFQGGIRHCLSTVRTPLGRATEGHAYRLLGPAACLPWAVSNSMAMLPPDGQKQDSFYGPLS